MPGAVETFISDLLYDEQYEAADAAKKWLEACQRQQDWKELYPYDGSPSQKAAHARVDAEIRQELLSLEANLAECFSRLQRARGDIVIPYCPVCWVDDGKRIAMRHERDHRYDRTDNDFYCSECGESYHSIEAGRYVG